MSNTDLHATISPDQSPGVIVNADMEEERREALSDTDASSAFGAAAASSGRRVARQHARGC